MWVIGAAILTQEALELIKCLIAASEHKAQALDTLVTVKLPPELIREAKNVLGIISRPGITHEALKDFAGCWLLSVGAALREERHEGEIIRKRAELDAPVPAVLILDLGPALIDHRARRGKDIAKAIGALSHANGAEAKTLGLHEFDCWCAHISMTIGVAQSFTKSQ
jgi:hypothetical protein